MAKLTHAATAAASPPRRLARRPTSPQSNFRENKAKAIGGDVTLKDVDNLVTQKGKHKATKNDATLTASGGDAIAVAACLNVLVGSATTVKPENDCGNTAVAVDGDVTLKDVFIDIQQK